MKKFKSFLREFRMNYEPPKDRTGRDGDNPHEDIIKFMNKTPFTHVTTGGHELHFKSSLDAAKTIAQRRVDHESAMYHASDIPDENMIEYFGMSTGTHDDVLDAIQHHIHNKLPSHLKPHISDAFQGLVDDAILMSLKVPMGKSVYHEHKPSETMERHPHVHDDAHHLGMVIKELKNDPDRGYFLHSDEK